MGYNDTICEFLTKNGINPENIPDGMNRPLKSVKNVTVLSSYLYSIYTKAAMETVSAGNLYGTDVIGMRYESRHHVGLIDLLEDFFDRDGDGYHSRSVELLDFSEEEVVEALKSSFQNDPIILTDIDGKLYVTVNGNHRSLVLLFHYLNSARKGTDLKDTFMFQAGVSHLNLELSGMLFMLKMKYGDRLRMNSHTIKNQMLQFSLDQQEYEVSIEEFKNFVHNEFSIGNHSIEELRDYYFVAIGNASNDPYFKKAMDGTFKGFNKMNLSHLEYLLRATYGYENEIRQIPIMSQTFEEYIENLKQMLLNMRIEALKIGIEEKKRLERLQKQLEIEESKVKKELGRVEMEMAEDAFYKHVTLMPTFDTMLEEEEKEVEASLMAEQKKRFSFGKKKKLLQERLEQLKSKLDQVGYFEYGGKSYTLREFCRFLKEAKERPERDLYHQKLKLEDSLFQISLEKGHHFRLEDCLYQIDSLKYFCDGVGIDFEEVLKSVSLETEVEELLSKRR